MPLVVSDSVTAVLVFLAKRFDPRSATWLTAIDAALAPLGALVERMATEARLRQKEAEARASRESLRQLSQRTEGLLEAERKQIARELHDQMGSDLTSIKIELQIAREDALGAAAGDAVEHIDAACTLVDSMAGSMRALATRLRPAVLDVYGLPAAIEWLAEQFGSRSSCEIVVEVDEGNSRLSDTQATVLFRICQEALTNVLRHADATRVLVALRATDGHVELRIVDNGRGLDESRLRSSQRLGVIGMRERAKAAGGRLQIVSPPSGGTEVRVVLKPDPSAGGEQRT
ncbi:MAG: sensor histidine kinase [Woeseiaceae bacterium]|nr:sensor histidine kinase [Woeseiaceae bacterium]